MQIDLPEKLYYSIGEVAKAFQVNTSLIRFWEKEFDILQPKKNKKGNRLFTNKDLKNLRKIYLLVKEEGYTLEGAKKEMQNNSKIDEEIEIITRLETIKLEITKLKSYFDEVDS